MNVEDDKKEKKSFDLLRVMGLRPKKIDEKYKKYIGMNRRMMAQTVDTLIAMLTIGPIIDWILRNSVHSRDITLEELTAIQNNHEAQFTELMKLLIESGKLTEFLVSTSLQVGLLILASIICWKLWSATPGKLLFRMKIVDADTEQPMTNRQMIIRGLGYIPSCALLFMGVFWIGLNKRKQGWHDLMANTVVISAAKNKSSDEAKEPAQPVV